MPCVRDAKVRSWLEAAGVPIERDVPSHRSCTRIMPAHLPLSRRLLVLLVEAHRVERPGDVARVARRPLGEAGARRAPLLRLVLRSAA